MLIKMNKRRFQIALFLLMPLVMACKHNLFYIDDIQHLELTKYIPGTVTKPVMCYNRDRISLFLRDFLNNSSEGFGKVFIEYKVVLIYRNNTRDTVYMNSHSYKSRKTGTRIMKKDAALVMEKFFR